MIEENEYLRFTLEPTANKKTKHTVKAFGTWDDDNRRQRQPTTMTLSKCLCVNENICSSTAKCLHKFDSSAFECAFGESFDIPYTWTQEMWTIIYCRQFVIIRPQKCQARQNKNTEKSMNTIIIKRGEKKLQKIKI